MIKKFIIMAVSLLMLAAYIMYQNGFFRTSKDAINMGSSQLTAGLSELSSTQYDVYDGSTQTGESVISVINSTFSDPNIEVLVCTKDGYNFIYNTEESPMFGVTTTLGSVVYDTINNYGNCYLITDPSNGQTLSNIAPYDATGKGFSPTDTAGSVAVVRKAPTEGHLVNVSGLDSSLNTKVETVAGYNTLAPIMAPGYISESAYFIGSVQKDVNNVVRRITFVQR